MSICLIHFSEFGTCLHKGHVTHLNSENTHESKVGEQNSHQQPIDVLQGFRFTIPHLPY